jgi:hypothetical protein
MPRHCGGCAGQPAHVRPRPQWNVCERVRDHAQHHVYLEDLVRRAVPWGAHLGVQLVSTVRLDHRVLPVRGVYGLAVHQGRRRWAEAILGRDAGRPERQPHA